MRPSIRSFILLCALALALLGGSALAGVLPVAPQQARAADETGEETTTTPEETTPEVETPNEPTTTPEPETPTTTPPVTTPPVGTGGESGGGQVETPKSTPSTGSEATVGGGGGGGSSSSSGGSAGSGSAGTTTTSPASAPSRQVTRAQTHSAGQRDGATGGNGTAGDRGPRNGGGRDASGGGAQHSPSRGARNPAPQPTVSPQAIDRGASAVSNAASHVGEAFAEALPTAPLKKIGDRLAVHIAAAGSGGDAKQRKQAVDRIGKALGAALIGSAVAVDRSPPASQSPIPFFTPPGGKSATLYLVLIAVLLLGVGALVLREARSALGWDAPRTGVRVADERPRIALRERIGVTLAGLLGAGDRWFSRFRRLRANAAAGLRSLF